MTEYWEQEEWHAGWGPIKVKSMYQGIRCKFCGSLYVVKNGTRGGTQYWLCKNCGRGFVDNKALPKMKYPIEAIASAVYQYYAGLSLNEIRGYIDQQYHFRPSDSAIYNWVTRFTKTAIDEANKYTPKVGDTWVADETVIKVGGKKLWLIDIIDQETRYLIATRLSETRGKKDIALLMRKAYLKAGKAPKRILTDGLKVYPDAVDLVFGSETKHVASKPFVEVDSTNVIERFQGTLKDRTKVMRGFKKPETATLILDGWLVYYNYLRPHESLGDKTPARIAGINFPYQNWLDIVKSLSSINQPITEQTKHGDSPVVTIRKPYKKRSKPKKSRSHNQTVPSITVTRRLK
jgi:putative transposase